ncbi:hypothetical protein AB0D67_09010 [Streptosporangium sp. NPDC048047]|uniref:hypothetical protein n=1 Tax=Streptosporangium sp. NPDC048047 TaxID=3155748 RepID=UPI00343EFBAA
MALTKKIIAAAALRTSAILVPAAIAASPASASASGSVSIRSNGCNLPTQARVPSKFIKSYSNCNTCVSEAYKRSQNPLGLRYYCTYNPSNNLNDLHLYLG